MQADISTAPITASRGPTGKICQERKYDIILLVGLTELKAQVGWIDSVTVSSQETSFFSLICVIWVLGVREKVRNAVTQGHRSEG